MEIGVRVYEVCMLLLTAAWVYKRQKNREWNAFDCVFLVLAGVYIGYAAWANGYNKASTATAEVAQRLIHRHVAERGCPIGFKDLPMDIEITAVLLETGPVIGSEKSGSLYVVSFSGVPRMKIVYIESAEGKVLPFRFRIERSDGGSLKVVPVQASVKIS